jgi:hypothetical protein
VRFRVAMIQHIAHITNTIMNVIVHYHVLGSSATEANIFSTDELGYIILFK